MIKKMSSESDIREICNSPKEIVLYGAGHYGKSIKRYLELIYGKKIKSFIISMGEECPEKFIDNVAVKKINELTVTQNIQVIICVSEQRQKTFIENALKYGYVDIYLALNECVRYMETQLNKNHLEPLGSLSFEVHITDHCNLNCRGCYHFSPLSGEDCLSLKEFENDMEQMEKICGDRVSSITLLGGEPLLHPELLDFIMVSRKFFPQARIKLLTNGILLNQMKDDFWLSCNKNKVSIFCTKYPIGVDYEGAEKTAKQYGLEISYHNDVNAGEKTLIKYPFDITGSQPIDWNYKHCTRSNKCITLKHGRLFTCPMAAHAHLAKEFFELDMELSTYDSVDIYSAKDYKDITNFLIKPIPFCRYCDLKIKPEQHEWSVSKRARREWF